MPRGTLVVKAEMLERRKEKLASYLCNRLSLQRVGRKLSDKDERKN